MDSDTLNTTVRIAALAAGIVLGSVSVTSACFVWVRNQLFGYGGLALCTAGVVLIGLSIWYSVEVGMEASGFSFKAREELAKLINDANKQTIAGITDANKRVDSAVPTIDKRQTAANEKLQQIEGNVNGIRQTLVAHTPVPSSNSAPKRVVTIPPVGVIQQSTGQVSPASSSTATITVPRTQTIR